MDANFRLLLLGQNCTYKTNNTLGQGQEPHAPTMNGGSFGRKTSDAKVRILREKCLENLARVYNLGYGVNEGVYIGVWPTHLGGRGPTTWMVFWMRFMICS